MQAVDYNYFGLILNTPGKTPAFMKIAPNYPAAKPWAAQRVNSGIWQGMT